MIDVDLPEVAKPKKQLPNVDYLDSTKRFQTLFTGLQRAYGFWKAGRAKTIKESITTKQYNDHINGVVGLGVVPINENNECYFGVIDIDIDTINHKHVSEQVKFLNMPLIVCSSKSGGAHLYTFFDKPVSARNLRKALSKYASDLGYGSSEIFPKQDTLPTSGTIGNWINLPYYDLVGDCNRLGYTEDGPMLFPQFLDVAEALAKDNPIATMTSSEMAPDGMPPCLTYFFNNGAGEGCRNEVLYSFGVFARKSDHPSLEDFLYDINYKVVQPPLPAKEVKTLVSSVSKQNYQYKCKHPVFKEHCDSITCKALKFGIDDTDSEKYNEHMVGCLTKISTNPVRWLLDINGASVEFSSEEIMNYQKVRCLTMERANIIAPPMRQEAWLLILKDRLEHVRIIEAPSDADVNGDICQVLAEFIQIADRALNGREDLLRGIPVKDKIWEEGAEVPVIMFRSQDLLTYIKRRKINLNMTNNVLWNQLRMIGVGHNKIKIASVVIQVWYVHMTDNYASPILEPLSPELDI